MLSLRLHGSFMENKRTVAVTFNGKTLTAEPGVLLSELIDGEKPCGGHGRCGKCKVRANGCLSPITDSERGLLSENELSCGIRLACLTRVLGDAQAELLTEKTEVTVLTDGLREGFEIQPTFCGCGVAVDIGTTTIAAVLYDSDGTPLADASCLNPQTRLGSDVISRIEAALAGKAEHLAADVRSAVNGIMETLMAKSCRSDVGLAVLTGNTVMLSLLTRQSTEPFSHAPFKAERLFGESMTAGELDISCLSADTPVYIPPCISAFVGADAVCAVLATGLCDAENVMLADIGTNGEMALWHDGRLSVCSTAAGPAFEGVGISMGMRGETGAIDSVSVVNGKLYAHVIGGGAPVGICGSGLVDATACMIDVGELDEGGYLEDGTYVIADGVELTQKDIRMLQLAKSAICAGLMTLMDAEDLTADSVTRLYVAGGFGNYLNTKSARRIGLLPVSLAERSYAVGNAALSGASMLLLNRDMKEKAERISKGARLLELSTSPAFSEYYMNGMLFGEV